MTTLLDRIDSRPAPADAATGTTPAQRLRATMAAVRLSFTWLGTKKTLTPEQRAQAAESARQAHYRRLALRSAEARKARKRT